ncbi:GNAT family N-acetyltransferase [Leucobacter sp. CSA1]|uniref:GNAT family N-acetyltransferase n=1 Tax=Leucobacter chromiisoli TaxID=2796471 RepID=A0A934Q7L9_9MICO|nr:GNAT family N-acetyltransferase [Leucobacter chromiisoli]MBK0419760.1 GNAT family N-acetyltransferase [Leucobacter chromiisoli]
MTDLAPGLSLHRRRGIAWLDPATLYRLLRLREQVFVVEQECAYAELDGRDLEPDTVQLWIADESGGVVATLRILNDDSIEAGLRRIGRVATAPEWRGRGIAAALMRAAMDECAGHPMVLDAQSHLAHWYARFGFEPDGAEFVEDGIPHTPMRRG